MRDLKRLAAAAILPAAAVSLFSAVSTPARTQDDMRWRFYTGLDYSTGDYSLSRDTKILFAPFAAQVETGNWRFKATVPWLRIEGPGGVVGGDGPIVGPPGGGPPGAVTSNSGIGDIILQGGYTVGGGNLPWVELIGKVKLPTASDTKGLGTGKTDISVQADIYQTVGVITPFATVGYRLFGDPAGIELRNTLYLSIGASGDLSETTHAGASLDWRRATTATSADRLEVSPFVTFDLTEQWSLTGYGVLGLKDGSPDTGLGVTLRFTM